jgi:hypothetical protein
MALVMPYLLIPDKKTLSNVNNSARKDAETQSFELKHFNDKKIFRNSFFVFQ